MFNRSLRFMTGALFGVLLAAGSSAQTTKTPKAANAASDPPLSYQPGLEPKAIEILKAASARLAAAHSLAFTAVVSYEGPSLLGPPLIYSTKSQVTVRRPDKLKVITLGDGPPSEFYYDGKLMMAFAPTENLVAVADAPPTIDAALAAAYDNAAIYFPFMDVIVSDPYKDFADGLTTAFYIGQSTVVEGTTTDMVAFVTHDVFAQMLPVVIAIEVLGALAIIVGWKTRITALLLAGFSLLTAVIFHSHFGDQIQMVMFLKNVSIAGGYLLLAANGAGPLSIDHRLVK